MGAEAAQVALAGYLGRLEDAGISAPRIDEAQRCFLERCLTAAGVRQHTVGRAKFIVDPIRV